MAQWCNQYNCWCSDAKEITDGLGDCEYNCKGCELSEDISAKSSAARIPLLALISEAIRFREKMTQQKIRPALQCQTDREKLIPRYIIPRSTRHESIYLMGFVGTVSDFRQFLKAQRELFNAGVLVP